MRMGVRLSIRLVLLAALLLFFALAGCGDEADINVPGGGGGGGLPISAVFVAAGDNHTVVIKNGRTLWAWGSNNWGQLGDNTTVGKLVPTQEFTAVAGWVAVSGGVLHTAALKSDRTIWAWGLNTNGQLGDGTITNRLTPTQEITFATDWVAVSASGNHTMALKSDGTLWAWGKNASGQLGDGSTTQRNVPTQEVTGATDWVAVSAGTDYSAALKSDGTLWAWGSNAFGQLGDGTIVDKLVPTQEIMGATNWVAVSAASIHTLALKSGGTLWGWGSNANGRLGDGTTTQRLVPTQEITTATDWVVVAAGVTFSAALKSGGTVWAWGTNIGQLGDGTSTQRFVPTQEINLATDWVAVAAGSSHTVALKSGGAIWAWGANPFGEVGDGTTTQRLVPTQEVTMATDWGP